MSVGVAEPTVHDPDAKGHFGAYGGRLVPEALMAVIEEVTAAYDKVRTDQSFLDELDRLQQHPPVGPRRCTKDVFLEHAGGARLFLKREDLEPHRFSQDQQRARAGAVGQADGQDPRHRRDRRLPQQAPPPPRARCWAWSASSTWARSTPRDRP